MSQKENNPKIHTIEQATKDFLIKVKTRIKESTFSRYSFLCERHIIPYFSSINLSNLTDESINGFIYYKLNNGGLNGCQLSPKTVNDIVCLLLQIVKNYCKLEISVEKPTYKQRDINIFTETEYNKLQTFLSIGIDNKKLGVIVAMLTGVRIGELCALKWENVNLKTSVINISKTIQRIKTTDNTEPAKTKIIIDTPKSSASIRTISLPSILVRKLECFRSNDNTYLLTNTTDYIEPRIYQRHFKSYLTSCDITDNNFHTIRHTFATMAISNEMDIKTLSVLLGHTDVSFTMKRYVHPNIEHKRQQMENYAMKFWSDKNN